MECGITNGFGICFLTSAGQFGMLIQIPTRVAHQLFDAKEKRIHMLSHVMPGQFACNMHTKKCSRSCDSFRGALVTARGFPPSSFWGAGKGHGGAVRCCKFSVQNEHLLANIGFNTAENEPSKIWQIRQDVGEILQIIMLANFAASLCRGPAGRMPRWGTHRRGSGSPR